MTWNLIIKTMPYLRVLLIKLINLLIVVIYYPLLTLILNLYIILLLRFHGTRDIGNQ